MNNGPDYKYKLRFNITSNRARSEGPYTERDITTELAFDNTTYFTTYLSKMAATTHVVNSIIAAYESGANVGDFDGKISPIYQEDFINDPLYGFVGNSL